MALDIVVSSEEDAYYWLQQALEEDQRLDNSVSLRFDGWPVLALHYEGRDFHSSVPTRIMPVLLQAQREIHRLYARLHYGTSDTRRLTKEDRERLELVVRVDPGSSNFLTDLTQVLGETLRGAVDRMESRHLMITILGGACIIGGVVAWNYWLDYQATERGIELEESEMRHEERMRELDNERIRTLQDAKQSSAALEDFSEGIDDFRNETLRQMKPADTVRLPGVPGEISGQFATRLTYTPRERAQETRIDGMFSILSVSSGETSGFRVRVRRVEDDRELIVHIPIEVLNHDRLTALQDSEWGKRPVAMSINARELRGEVTSATLVSVNDLDDDALV